MHSTSSANRSLSSSIILLVTFLLLSTQVLAAPSVYEEASAVEGVFFRALGQVGPARQIERLRLRRNVQAIASSLTSDPASLLKSKAQHSVDSLPILNPKRRSNATPILNSKRQLLTPTKVKTQQSIDSVPRAILNPKRSLDHEVDMVRRSIADGVQSIVANPKRDSSGVFVGGGAGLFSFGLGPVIIPNPKSPNYPTSSRATPTTSMPLSTSTVAPAASTSAVAPPAATVWPTGPMIAAAYYPDWQGTLMPPSLVDFNLFDLIDFGKCLLLNDYSLLMIYSPAFILSLRCSHLRLQHPIHSIQLRHSTQAAR